METQYEMQHLICRGDVEEVIVEKTQVGWQTGAELTPVQKVRLLPLMTAFILRSSTQEETLRH